LENQITEIRKKKLAVIASNSSNSNQRKEEKPIRQEEQIKIQALNQQGKNQQHNQIKLKT